MEDVLEVYQRPYDAARPVICLDEQSKQLIRETRVPLPAASARNTAECCIDWRFTTADARIKPKRLYPSIQLG